MGEQADYIIDQLMDEGWSTYRPRARPKAKTCKYCGTGGLWWHQMTDGTWRLISYSNDTEMRPLVHSCLNRSHPELEELDE